MTPANGNANPNNQINDEAYFCPTCGGADITASALAGGDAGCSICGWKGKKEELALFRFSQDLGTPEDIARHFFLDLRRLFSQQLALDIGQLLIKWGFLEAPNPKNKNAVQKTLVRYIAGAAQAVAESVIKTRATLEKERHGAPPSA